MDLFLTIFIIFTAIMTGGILVITMLELSIGIFFEKNLKEKAFAYIMLILIWIIIITSI